MKKKIFCVSDTHGNYNALKDSLNNVSYEPSDENLLIIDGDLFDRGKQSLEIYNYIKSLGDKAIVIRGNHETFLQELLEGKNCSFNFIHNGLDKTIDSFLGEPNSWSTFINDINELDGDSLVKKYGSKVLNYINDGELIPKEHFFEIYQACIVDKLNNMYPELLDWLKSLPYYYETENYIFTHASIDGNCPDWHNPDFTPYSFWSPWEALTWDDGSFYKKEIKNTDKTIVVGHFHTDRIREINGLPTSGDNTILKSTDGKKVFIDTCTPVTQRVNVFITEDELI